jgi:hypothetical protein
LAGNKDGLIDSDELYNYTVDHVSLVGQRELNAKQTPVRVIGEDVVGRFLLTRIAPSGKIRVNDAKGVAGKGPVGPDLAAGGAVGVATGPGPSSMTESLAPSAIASSTVKKPVPLPGVGKTKQEGEFVPLFNGKDLSGWRQLGNIRHNWKVDQAGVLEGSGPAPASVLTTDFADFANFHLRVETKLAEGPNSGIKFRVTESNGESVNYIAYIGGTAGVENLTGCLSFQHKNGNAPLATTKLAQAAPVVPINPGEWFTEEVIADGDVITVIVQGVEVARREIPHRKLMSGTIELVCRSNSRVVFRKIEIKELPMPSRRKGVKVGAASPSLTSEPAAGGEVNSGTDGGSVGSSTGPAREPVGPDLAAGRTVGVATGSGSSSMNESLAPSAIASSAVKKPALSPVIGAINTKGAFQPLFNGKDLKGWEIGQGDARTWRVENQTLVAVDAAGRGQDARGQGRLLTGRSFKEFIFRFEYQSLSSDIGFTAIWWALPGEVPPTFNPSASALGLGTNRRGQSFWRKVIASELKEGEGWNMVEIEARDRLIRISVNGRETVRTVLGEKPAEPTALKTTKPDGPFPRVGMDRRNGRVGFQFGKGTGRFRRIEIKEL